MKTPANLFIIASVCELIVAVYTLPLFGPIMAAVNGVRRPRELTIDNRRYRVKQELGSGARGTAFLAASVYSETGEDGEDVVIKRFHRHIPEELYNREVANLDYTNELIGNDHVEGFNYNVQKLVPGKNLLEALPNYVLYQPHRVPEIRDQLVNTIKSFHKEEKLAHNDLHIGNVMLRDEKEDGIKLKVIDYDQSAPLRTMSRRDREWRRRNDLEVALATFDSKVQALKMSRNDFA